MDARAPDRVHAGSFPRWVRHYYPLTLGGSLLLLLILPVLVNSLRVTNPFGLVLSLVAVLALTALAVMGRIQANAYDDLGIQWDSSRPIYARVVGCVHRVETAGRRLLPFFRVHLDLTARLRVGRNAWIYLYHEYSSKDGRSLEIPWDLPLSGLLTATSRLAIKDLFGLSRARFDEPHVRTLVVQPAPFPDVKPAPIAAIHGEEDSSRHTQADEERYFMREYAAGDRFRDINWKASSRLAELVTRISPLTQEKTQLVQLEFRHFAAERRDSLEAIVHLDYLKSWLITFLRRQKRDNPRFRFRVITGVAVHELAEEGDVERFGQELAVLFMQPDPGVDTGREDGGEVFLFSTPFDTTVGRALAFYRRARVRLYRTVDGSIAAPTPSALRAAPAAQRAAPAALRAASSALRAASSAQPDVRVKFGTWLLGGKMPMLPGGWVFRRSRRKPAAAGAPPADLQEAPLRVALLA